MLEQLLNWFARKILGENDSHESVKSVGSKSGGLFWMKKLILLLLFKYVWPKRFRAVAEFEEMSKNFENSGYLATEKEWKTDKPKRYSGLINERDSISFYAGNSDGDKLNVEFVSLPHHKGKINLYIHLLNDEVYVLDQYPDTTILHTDKDSFSGAGLKLSCISPFRKWKLSFNGRLKKLNGSDEDSIHAKFSFTFTPTSLLYEVGCDTDQRLVADWLATGSLADAKKRMNKTLKPLEIYEQWGMYMGTIKIGTEEEKKVTLWGRRERDRSIYSNELSEKAFSYYGALKSGQSISVGSKLLNRVGQQLQHGYIHLANRQLYPVHRTNVTLDSKSISFQHSIIVQGKDEKQSWTVDSIEKISVDMGPYDNSVTEIYFASFSFKGQVGHGIVKIVSKNLQIIQRSKEVEDIVPLIEVDMKQLSTIPKVVSFEEEACQCSDVTGGKGCSLALLNKLSQQDKQFIVPKGLVLTTSAYKEHLQHFPQISSYISKLQQSIGNLTIHQLKEECSNVTQEFLKTTLSKTIKQQLETKLKELFGNNLNDVRLAVRSSAIGEDSDETSSAGQMTTILGVRGLDKVCEAVCKCWSSQFDLTAVQYKRQNGLELNPGMAVVVQEMVPAEVAGVTFTCDPVTGDPGMITITANYGLGESVVSASSEPDTFVLKKEEGLRVSMKEVTIGRKAMKIRMDEIGGTVEEILSPEETSRCCLAEDLIINLGVLSRKVERAYNTPRDIEWGIVGSQLYLLQSRPVTTIHKDSDFDIAHELDTGLLAEFEYNTRANVGEVMPGTMSPITVSIIFKGFDICFSATKRKEFGESYIVNPFASSMMSLNTGHAFINILDFILKETDDSGLLSHRVWEIAIFGRLLDDSMIQAAVERNGYCPHLPISAIKILWKSFWTYNKSKITYRTYPILDPSKFKNSLALYKAISENVLEYFMRFDTHIRNSEASSIFNMLIIESLADYYDGGLDDLMKDVALMLTDCSNLESADVPAALQNLSETIYKSQHKEKFINMKTEDAVAFLSENKGAVGKAYDSLIKRHAHRCLKEFDFSSVPWGENPAILVKNIQTMVKNTRPTEKDKELVSAWMSVCAIKHKLPLTLKLKLWYLVLCARFGVKIREFSKSWIIKIQDYIRKPLNRLGKLLVEEGKLPDANLLFYITHDELKEIVDHYSSSIVNKARHRYRVYQKLDKLRFPEISSGVPKPINVKRATSSSNGENTTQMLKGITVSQGVTRGIARVIMDYEECEHIQQDDILITYSTDVGWTPYFPLLSGVVTEIGGLVSHGAVVAREYGLPCLVGVVGATECFKSGDYVILDATNGVLKKIAIEDK